MTPTTDAGTRLHFYIVGLLIALQPDHGRQERIMHVIDVLITAVEDGLEGAVLDARIEAAHADEEAT